MPDEARDAATGVAAPTPQETAPVAATQTAVRTESPAAEAAHPLATEPLAELSRVREQVLDLAGRGVSTERICAEVDLNPKEVSLILKSLFRPRT